MPEKIIGYTNMAAALKEARVILLVVPTKAIRETVQSLVPLLTYKVTVIHASKGIEPGTHKRISEMIEEEFTGTDLLKDVVVLSGPSHAEEVSLRQPTTVTVSSKKSRYG